MRMTWLWIVLGVIVVPVVVVLVWGALLPVGHSATVTGIYRATPARVWALLTDVEGFPEWRTDLKRVELRERDADGKPRAWTEHSSFGPIPLRTLEAREPELLVGKIDSDDLGFGGTWTYRIEDLGDGQVRLSITEDGEVTNVFFRFMSRYVFGYDKTMKTYHNHLERALSG